MIYTQQAFLVCCKDKIDSIFFFQGHFSSLLHAHPSLCLTHSLFLALRPQPIATSLYLTHSLAVLIPQPTTLSASSLSLFHLKFLNPQPAHPSIATSHAETRSISFSPDYCPFEGKYPNPNFLSSIFEFVELMA